MKSKILFLLLLTNILFANTQTQGSQTSTSVSKASKTTEEQLAKIFPQNDAVVENQGCSWECRAVNKNYKTQISGFDFKNGITYCKVFEETNLDQELIYNANKKNLSCKNDIYKDIKNDTETEIIKKLAEQEGYESQIKYEAKENDITLSQFLSGLVTLNPDFIDREATKLKGELTLKDGIKLKSTATIKQEFSASNIGSVGDLFNIEAVSIYNAGASLVNDTARFFGIDYEMGKEKYNASLYNDSYEETTSADGFNKANMAYFSDLFMNMEKIYEHLQILLFVVVGGFYIASIGANKLQIYLENRGENATNQPYLHKFYIPLLMVGTFFMPIPEANGTAHSTLVQKTIRYFTVQGTEIADMASAIGGKTYMDKIYKSVGGINSAGIDYLLMEKYLNNYKTTQAEQIYKETCAVRYSDNPSISEGYMDYLKLTEEEKEKKREKFRTDREQVAGTKYDITLEACVFLEQEINRALRDNKTIEEKLTGIKAFYEGQRIKNRFKEIDTYFSIRENQLGWINSLITPSSAILAEVATFADASISKQDMESATKKNIENNKRAIENKDVEVSDEGEINDGVIGFIMGRLVWMMLPGSDNVKKFIDNMYDKIKNLLTGLLSFASSPLALAFNFISGLSIIKTPLVYYAATYVIESTFEKVPLLVCTTASIVAFISYLVSLCKYFYISPFVVAFSLATKRTNKIVDFLVSGIAIFFQPVLIVLFIYLALFVHTLINEIFVFISIEQFTNIKLDLNSPSSFITHIVASGITGLLKIFGILASSYIMWKLIVSGASWAMSLVGIDGKQGDVIAQGIEANLARRAFVA